MPNTVPPDVVSAFVVASTVDTPYRAAGRGAPVVVLALSAATQAALLAHTPRNLRVLVPALTGAEPHLATASSFAEWLINFVDALGIARFALIADAALAAHVIGFTTQCPERVHELALLKEEQAAENSFASVPIERYASGRELVMSWPPGLREPAAHVAELLAQLFPVPEATTPPPP